MAFITQVGTERRLQLSNEDFTRGLVFGSAWTRLRIGAKIAFTGTIPLGSAFSPYVGGMGVCHGPQGYLNPNPILGFFGHQISTSWTYRSDATGLYWEAVNGNSYAIMRRGTTTATSAGTGSVVQYIANGTVNTCQYFVEIVKNGAGVMTCSMRCPSAADAVRTISAFDFLRNMENEIGTIMFAAQNTNFPVQFTHTLDVPFDTVNVFHNHTNPTLEIAALEVVRFE